MKSNNYNNMRNVIIAALSGIATGTVIGLLLAPDKGTKTRKKLRKTGDAYINDIKNDIKKIQKYLEKRADTTKSELNELSQNAKNKGEEVLQNAKKMTSYEEWTKEELYERAKEAKIDSYSQMNKDELIEALKKK